MSNSIQQWILKDLKQYAERNAGSMGRPLLPESKAGRKCLLLKWITPPQEQQKGAAVWAYVFDTKCVIPVKFEREAIANYELTHGQSKFSNRVGSVCTLRQIKLLFTKVPLDNGQVGSGLSVDDRLVLQVSEVRVSDTPFEVANWTTQKDPQTGVKKSREPEQDQAIARWVKGLRTGNGHILQVEKERARDDEQFRDGFTPPSSPPRSLAQDIKKQGLRSAEWDMPLEQKELFERYNGQGVPEPESDVFSDESDSDVEGERVLSEMNKYDPNFEFSAAPSSPVTVIYSGWQSSPARGPVYAEDSDDENGVETSQVEDTLRNYSPAAENHDEIPCAQPQQPLSPSLTFASVHSVKEESASQVLPPSIGPSADVVPDAPLSWPTILNGQSQDAEPEPEPKGKNKGKGKEKEEESQESMISTIAPNSSNEISCSPAFPPAQRSFAAVEEDDLRESQDSESERDGNSPHTWEGGSQLSAIGDDLSEEVSSSARGVAQIGEEDSESANVEVTAEEKYAQDASPSSLPPFEPTPKPQPKRLDSPSTPEGIPHKRPGPLQNIMPVNVRKSEPQRDVISEPSPHSLHSTPFLTKKPPVSTSFDSRAKLQSDLPQLENPPLTLDDVSSALMSVQPRAGHSVKRSIDEVESSVDRIGKKPKFDQPSRAALPKPHTADSRASRPSKEYQSTASTTRPALVGNGKDLRHWNALQPPQASTSRGGSTRSDYIDAYLPLHNLTKILGTSERRSTKYSLPSRDR